MSKSLGSRLTHHGQTVSTCHVVSPIGYLPSHGRRQVKQCAVDTYGERAEREPIVAESLAKGSGCLKLKTFWVLVPNRTTKFASFSVFCKLPKPRVGVVGEGGVWGVEPPVHVYRHPFLSENRL